MTYELKDFWDKVDIKSADECWEWKGGLHKKGGYGYTYYYKDNIYERLAHRVAWVLHHQTNIPKGLLICHTCDNKRCCNPSHLYYGNNSANMQDRSKRGRHNYAQYAYGRFTEGEMWLIRKLRVVTDNDTIYKKYKFSAALVAKMFKTSETTILRIWKSDKFLSKEGTYV